MKIHITGASGCGVSTLGKNLSEQLGIKVFDADDYFWVKTDPPFVEQVPPDVRMQNLHDDLKKHEKWILSGSAMSWSRAFQHDFTHVIFLQAPTEIRIARLIERERGLWGTRINPGNDMHKGHVEFIEWAAQYDIGDMGGRSLMKHEAWLKNLKCPIFRIDSSQYEEVVLAEALKYL